MASIAATAATTRTTKATFATFFGLSAVCFELFDGFFGGLALEIAIALGGDGRRIDEDKKERSRSVASAKAETKETPFSHKRQVAGFFMPFLHLSVFLCHLLVLITNG